MTDQPKAVRRLRYYAAYTGVFIVTACLVYGFYLFHGKSLIFWDTNDGGDGLVQHFNAFVYYGKYLRLIIKTFLETRQFQVPMWDLSIGYGQDIISTLSYYVIGDPFSALSVFFRENRAEYGYCFLILLRLYAAGLTFSHYCRYRGHRSFAVLPGCLIYVFSAYALLIASLHPYFVLPMIWLPLLMTGVEKVYRDESPLLFILAVAIAGLSNFYFFYMLVIMTALYAVFRYFQLFGLKKLHRLLLWGLKFLCFGALGGLMACVLLLPGIMNILTSSRIGAATYVPAFYRGGYYLCLLANFLTTGIGDVDMFYAHMGYTAVGLIAVLALIVRSRKEKALRPLLLGFLILVCFILFPFAGHFFNGMSYVTNRWIWGMACMVGYIIVVMTPKLAELSDREWKGIFGLTALYLLLLFIFPQLRKEVTMAAMVSVILLCDVCAFLIRSGRERLMTRALTLAAVLCVGLNALYCTSPNETGRLDNFGPLGQAYKELTKEAPAYALNQVADDDIYRFDLFGYGMGSSKRNSAMQLGRYGTSYYFSSTNGRISEFIRGLALNYSLDNSYISLDKRAALQAVAGVRYLITPADESPDRVYGFDRLVAEDEDRAVYTGDNTLPMIFCSDRLIDKRAYDALSPIRKQQALLQGIVAEAGGQGTESLAFTETSLPYEMVFSDGVSFENGTFSVTEANAKVTLECQIPEDTELYLYWEGMDFRAVNPETGLLKRFFWQEPTGVHVDVATDRSSTTLSYKGPKDSYYSDRHDYLCSLGYDSENRENVVLTFETIGNYTMKELEVICQPMDGFSAQVQALNGVLPDRMDVSVNRLEADFSLAEAQTVCLAIPYSEGWTAVVDGNPEQTFCADVMFTGLKLPGGEHHLVMTYKSPWLLPGAALSLAGIGLTILTLLARRIIGRGRQVTKDEVTEMIDTEETYDGSDQGE